MEILFRIAGIGIITAILHRLLVQAGREEQALMLSIGGLVVVMFMIITEIYRLFEAVRTMFTY